MDLDRLSHAPRIALAAAIAIGALSILELGAYFGFHESASERNAFGFSPDTAFSVDDAKVTIDLASSRRFWPQQYPRARPLHAKRIIVVGDSAIRGAALDQSLTEGLRRRLEQHCETASEIWNLSSPGYGSRRKAVVVHKALEFHPDLIIYHAGVTTEYEDEREWERYVAYHSWHPRHWVDQLPFLGRVKLAKLERIHWQWLPDEVSALSNRDSTDARVAAIASKFDTGYWMPRMLANLDRTVDEVTAANVPLLILTHATIDRTTGQVTDDGLDAAITARYASRRNVLVASNRQLFSSHGDAGALFFDTSHWTPEGNDVLANQLSDRVVRVFNATESCSSGS